MSNLLFFRRSDAYRHAAATEFNRARTLPPGAERNQLRKRARALRDLAREEAWLEGRPVRRPRNQPRCAIALSNPWSLMGMKAAEQLRPFSPIPDRRGPTVG